MVTDRGGCSGPGGFGEQMILTMRPAESWAAYLMKHPAAPQGGISAMIPADKTAALRQAAGYSGKGE